MNKLMNILQDASALIDGKPMSFCGDDEDFHNEAFEPTPIGPNGIRVDPFSPISFKPTFEMPTSADRRASVRAFQDFFFDEDTFASNLAMQQDPMDDVLSDVTMVRSNGTIGNVVLPPATLSSPFSLMPPPAPMSVTPTASPSSARKTKKTKHKKKLQTGLWKERFQDLLDFQKEHGHLFVPHKYAKNLQLAQWVKRQRYQYRLKKMGQHNTLSDDREKLLEGAGFIWDAHNALWMERYQDMVAFHAKHGHCNVPHDYTDPSLSVWMKHQRRQWKRLCNGIPSTMTQKRYQQLCSLGFQWNPRNLK